MISKGARVHPLAKVHPNAWVYERATIGARTEVRAVTVGFDVSIGCDCKIEVEIPTGCHIPDHVHLPAGCWFLTSHPIGWAKRTVVAVQPVGESLHWYVGCQHRISTEAFRERLHDSPAHPAYAHFIDYVLSHPERPRDESDWWDKVPETLRWVAMDDDGEWWGFMHKPTYVDGEWRGLGDEPLGFAPPIACKPKDSLMERPQ